MRVLSNMTGKLAALPRLGAAGAAALILTPAAFSLFLPVSVALPAGAGVALAGALAAFAVNVRRSDIAEAAPQAETSTMPAALNPLFDQLPGLVTIHNERGLVTAIKGRDRKAMLEGMRQVSGRGLLDQVHVSDRIRFLQAIDRLRQGNEGEAISIRFEKSEQGTALKDQFLYRQLYLSALKNEQGAFDGFFVQILDNSEEEALRRELTQSATDAATANEAKSRFLAAVSHELRTPLNAILGFSDILAGEYFGKLENDRQREYVGLINQSGNHLLAVVNTMLDMSKIEAGHYELLCEPFEVSEVASSCEAMLSLQAKSKGVTLTSRVARDAGEVVADRRALKQVLINLVGNAIKFTDEGGVVCVDIERDGGRLKIAVSDTGIGIPADKIELLGKPFMQVQNEYSRKYEGTGLGLSLVKGLVALHGGTFEIESTLGEGTVTTIVIPDDCSAQTMEHENEAGAEDTGEFPPRLTRNAEEKTEDRGKIHEHAKAQTA